MALKISEEVKVQMPMKTVASLITIVAIGTWAFFSFQEKLNQHSTQLEIMDKDVVMNTEFRIKWPRGLLGSLPADSEQFMLIEELYKQIDKLQIRVDSKASIVKEKVFGGVTVVDSTDDCESCQ